MLIPPKRYSGFTLGQVGMVVGLLSITAFFTALILAYALILQQQIVKARIEIPATLWLSTVLLLLSSAALEWARHSLRRAQMAAYRVRIRVTCVFGLGFLVSQLWSWWALKQAGVYVRSNPRGSVFYVFTGAHGLHLFSGILALLYLLHRARVLTEASEGLLRRHRMTAGAVALYWHFMDVLWLVLFALLLVWR